MAQPSRLHRRFEVLPGAQVVQVDWGDEGFFDTPDCPLHVWSFRMTLSFSRDPFACCVTSQDVVTFLDCHRRAFDHFVGVPATIIYDRTRRWCASTCGAPPRCRWLDVSTHF